jgi:hypothetical protein
MSAGIKANNDGSAAIQVGGSDFITISAAGAVAIPGTLTVGGIPSGGNYALVAYTSPATGPAAWDATTKIAAGLKAIKVTVVGAGGNGGNHTATSPVINTRTSGAGGGGGGAAIKYIPAPSIPGPVAVTAGPGTNSFGPFCSATAGGNGTNSPTSAPTVTLSSGTGGTGSGGDINIPGGDGGGGVHGAASTTFSTMGMSGGSSIMGAAGSANNSSLGNNNVNGIAGKNYGGGGGGATGEVSGLATGGAGAPGIVIVEEFY